MLVGLHINDIQSILAKWTALINHQMIYDYIDITELAVIK